MTSTGEMGMRVTQISDKKCQWGEEVSAKSDVTTKENIVSLDYSKIYELVMYQVHWKFAGGTKKMSYICTERV